MASFIWLPVIHEAEFFALPFHPTIPCFGLLSTIHLLVTLEIESFFKLFIWETCAVLLYFCYGIFHTDDPVQSLTPLLAPSTSSAAAEV